MVRGDAEKFIASLPLIYKTEAWINEKNRATGTETKRKRTERKHELTQKQNISIKFPPKFEV
jgi:hypothetical protein